MVLEAWMFFHLTAEMMMHMAVFAWEIPKPIMMQGDFSRRVAPLDRVLVSSHQDGGASRTPRGISDAQRHTSPSSVSMTS